MHCTREEADSLNWLLPEAGAVILTRCPGREAKEVPKHDGGLSDHELPSHFISK